MKPLKISHFRQTFSLILGLILLLSTYPGQANRGLRVTTIKNTEGAGVVLYKESYALIIGISNYTAGWPILPGVKKDVEAVEKVLKKQGFATTTVSDSNREGIIRAFEHFINQHGQEKDNRLLFYFAGHGHTLKQSYGDEMGYIVPNDAPNPNRDKSGFLSKAIDMQQIEVFAKRIQSKHALFLFDSCFSGSLFALSRAVPQNISYKTAKPVRQFITSGSANEEVPDESIFRKQFVSALSGEGDTDKDGYITGTELGEFLQKHVVNYSYNAQHPQYGKIRNPYLDKGDYVFVAGGSISGDEEIIVAKTGAITISGQPKGAKIYLNNAYEGKSPLTLKKLTPGRQTIKVSKRGYEDYSEIVNIRSGRQLPWGYLLNEIIKTGVISIQSNINEAKWYLDGGYMGKVPDKARDIHVGSHTITVKKAGYSDWEKQIMVNKGKMTTLTAALTQEDIEYELRVNRTPSDARVRILNIKPTYYDGLRLKPGNYHVEVSKSGYQQSRQWVTLGDVDKTINVRLEKPPAPEPVIKSSHEMIKVPGGCFQMGSNYGQDDEKPVHKVCLDDYWMGKTEVTLGQYMQFVKSTNYQGDGRNGWKCNGMAKTEGFKQGKDHPVACVSWKEANAYAKWMSKQTGQSYHLPTEAQWEYACRSGGKDEKYCGGNKLNALGWYEGNSGNKTHAVGQKQANGLGLYDMSGNVYEWTQDWYGEAYYSSSSRNNPKGPSSGSDRVRRGGSWYSHADDCRSAYRFRISPDRRYGSIGFRLARTKN